MSSPPEYLNMHVFRNVCNLQEQELVATWFRTFFQNHRLKIKEPLNDDGLRLFIMLGLFYPLARGMSCMARTRVDRNREDKRCQNKIDIHSLCTGMQRIWDISRSPTLQREDLLRAMYEVSKGFCCESQHRETHFAEQLAMEWYPVVEQFREMHPMLQATQIDVTVKIEEVKPVIDANGWAVNQ